MDISLFGAVVGVPVIAVWLAVAAVLAAIEAFTQGLTTIWFAGGAVAAARHGDFCGQFSDSAADSSDSFRAASVFYETLGGQKVQQRYRPDQYRGGHRSDGRTAG